MRTLRLIAIALVVVILTAGGVYAALEGSSSATPSLAAYAPPGALLAVESRDFGALLQAWNDSAEQRRWLAGDDYAGFSRSRLYGRLNDAQTQFATAAGLAPDGQFLKQVAGSESLFAWYDIGNLEFLYITRLPSDKAAQMPLLAMRDKFEQRQAGGVTFYIRNSEDAANATPSALDNGADDSRPRTVAFAISGDTLLLATREDLIAGALEQMAHPGGRSLATDSWYAASIAAANEKPGDLRLTLDLAKITRSPYFRTYWVQQNITATRSYAAALSDLYREAGVFREERFLLPSGTVEPSKDIDLTPVLRFLPEGVVYRAVAAPSADDALRELEDKLIARGPASISNPHVAPAADLSVPIAGDPSDLDDRIDTTRAPSDSRAAALIAIQSMLNTDASVAMLSFSTAAGRDASDGRGESSAQSDIFSTIHTGVVLALGSSCDATAWQQALSAALSPRVSVGDAGLHWSKQSSAKVSWFRLDGSFALAFAAQGDTCLFASDPDTLLAMLSASDTQTAHQPPARSIAGFSHATQRTPLLHLVSLLDRGSKASAGTFGNGNKPSFFSGNMASLSDTFQDVDSETFIEFDPSPSLTRQTVSYRWRSR